MRTLHIDGIEECADIVFGLVLISIVMISLFIAIKVKQKKRHNEWEECSAVITNVIDKGRGNRYGTRIYKIEFQYIVSNILFYGFTHKVFSEQDFEKIQKVGDTYTIWFNPLNPDHILLDDALERDAKIFLNSGIFFGIFAIILQILILW